MIRGDLLRRVSMPIGCFPGLSQRPGKPWFYGETM